MKAILALCVLLAICARPTAQKLYEFRFWPGPGAEQDAGIEILDHPCGEAAVARVSRMPSLDSDGPLGADKVLGFSPAGEGVMRWAIPTDTSIDAVRGDALLVSNRAGAYWISIDGTITEAQQETTRPEPVPASCNLSEFVESDYARCWTFRDEADGSSRTLGFEGVCT